MALSKLDYADSVIALRRQAQEYHPSERPRDKVIYLQTLRSIITDCESALKELPDIATEDRTWFEQHKLEAEASLRASQPS